MGDDDDVRLGKSGMYDRLVGDGGHSTLQPVGLSRRAIDNGVGCRRNRVGQNGVGQDGVGGYFCSFRVGEWYRGRSGSRCFA